MTRKIRKSKLRRQCPKCPWKVDTNPHEIPNGYCEAKHRKLAGTVADPGSLVGLRDEAIRIMACHESPVGREVPCVGWLLNQLGPGNNIPLRFLVMNGRIDANVEAVGPQHERLEDTFPKGRS